MATEQLRAVVVDAIEECIQTVDADQELSFTHYDAILMLVSDEVMARLSGEMRSVLSVADRQAIKSRVSELVEQHLASPTQSRFQKFERVVCRIGGEVGWAPGTIQALDEADPEDPTGLTTLPYVVKLDAPIARLTSVPHDDNGLCRAEVCFGQYPHGALAFTLRCKPLRPDMQKPRFGLGDRVSCAVEDMSGLFTVWAAGKVTAVNYDVEQDARELGLSWDWAKISGVMPYRVLLDNGATVLVHRDAHWLVRDLALQPAGPRQAADGTRDLKRLVRRRRDDSSWELIDHATRKVRVQAGGDTSDDDSDDAMDTSRS